LFIPITVQNNQQKQSDINCANSRPWW